MPKNTVKVSLHSSLNPPDQEITEFAYKRANSINFFTKYVKISHHVLRTHMGYAKNVFIIKNTFNITWSNQQTVKTFGNICPKKKSDDICATFLFSALWWSFPSKEDKKNESWGQWQCQRTKNNRLNHVQAIMCPSGLVWCLFQTKGQKPPTEQRHTTLSI